MKLNSYISLNFLTPLCSRNLCHNNKLRDKLGNLNGGPYFYAILVTGLNGVNSTVLHL